MYSLLSELFPYNRSITGDGVRQTLNRISKEIPIKISSVKSGTKVYDWTVPNEWNVKGAKITGPDGIEYANFDENNLHLMSYSIPVKKVLSLEELKKKIITDESRPNTIPYSTSYYKPNWAFCMKHNDVMKMPEGNYEVQIDTTIEPGELIYGEAYLDSNAKKTVLISSYICHPSMANDSLSGVVIAVQLYKELKKIKNLQYNYKFLFVPETIGTICFLNNNEELVKETTEFGIVATCLGDSGNFTYKKSRRQNSKINKVVDYVFKKNQISDRIIEFSPLGSDERQYCSPGFDLPVGVLTRSMYSEFSEYHSSDDNLDFVSEESLQESLDLFLEIIKTYEANNVFKRKEPHCEPQMGKYSLYRDTGGAGKDRIDNISQQRMWILNYADGRTDLIDVSLYSGFDILELNDSTKDLLKNKLIEKENIN